MLCAPLRPMHDCGHDSGRQMILSTWIQVHTDIRKPTRPHRGGPGSIWHSGSQIEATQVKEGFLLWDAQSAAPLRQYRLRTRQKAPQPYWETKLRVIGLAMTKMVADLNLRPGDEIGVINSTGKQVCLAERTLRKQSQTIALVCTIR
jgi:hypothetical protein